MIKIVKKHQIIELKRFALTAMWVFPAVFMVLLPWLFERQIPWWPAVLSLIMAILYFIYPKWLYYPYRVWMTIAIVLGWVNTRIILGLAFYGLILPIGLLLRLFGKLQYKDGRTDPNQTASFYIDVVDNKTKENLKDPF